MLSHYRVLCESKRRTCLKPLVFFNKALLKLLFRHPNTNIVRQATWKPGLSRTSLKAAMLMTPSSLLCPWHTSRCSAIIRSHLASQTMMTFSACRLSLITSTSPSKTIQSGLGLTALFLEWYVFIIFIPYTYNGIYANYSSPSSILVWVTSAIYWLYYH